MSLIEQMWQWIETSRPKRLTAPPPVSDLWKDLTKANFVIHTQAQEIVDLREALAFLSTTVEELQAKVDTLTKTVQ